MTNDEHELVAAARAAALDAYAPYSNFAVGAALLFEDGEIVTGADTKDQRIGPDDVYRIALSELLPAAFGPASLD